MLVMVAVGVVCGGAGAFLGAVQCARHKNRLIREQARVIAMYLDAIQHLIEDIKSDPRVPCAMSGVAQRSREAGKAA